jgi:hypothetical protein
VEFGNDSVVFGMRIRVVKKIYPDPSSYGKTF